MATLVLTLWCILLLAVVLYPLLSTMIKKRWDVVSWLWIIVCILVIDVFACLGCCALDDYSTTWLLEWYGYDFDGAGLEYVKECDVETVQSLLHRHFGIGWPLKAMAMYALLLPIHLLLSFVAYIYTSRKR